MRGVARRILVVALLAVCCTASFASRVTAQTNGITVTPAMLTFSLAKVSASQTGAITIVNQYAIAIRLHFTFERRLGQSSGADPTSYLHISQTDLALNAGEATEQTISVNDTSALSPGSQLADLVITQIAEPGSNVGVVPSIRIPLTIIKQDGAITALSLGSFSTPKVDMSLPRTLGITIRNTGNVTAIPRGTVTVTTPGHVIIRQGVLNTASTAIAPGGKLVLTAPLTQLDRAYWPGIYTASVSYGLGGDQQATTVSKRFLYIAWWHVLLFVAFSAALYTGVKNIKRIPLPKKASLQPPSSHQPPKPKKRPILIGRNA